MPLALLGPGMYGRIPIAASDQAALGIMPPGKTQSAVELQPAKLYCSPFVTAYPNLFESVVGQSLQGAADPGQLPAGPGLPSTVPVKVIGSNWPPSSATLGVGTFLTSALCTILVP